MSDQFTIDDLTEEVKNVSRSNSKLRNVLVMARRYIEKSANPDCLMSLSESEETVLIRKINEALK